MTTPDVLSGLAGRGNLKVIHGNGKGALARAPGVNDMSSAELTADMALLFAIGLLRGSSPDVVCNPHARVQVDAATVCSAHDLLCELRNLPWFDASIGLPSADDREQVFTRRGSRWNRDRQLTLRTLLRMGAGRQPQSGFGGRLLRRDALFGDVGRAGPITGTRRHFETLSDIAEHVSALPPGRPFFTAVRERQDRARAGGAEHGDHPTEWGAAFLNDLLVRLEAEAIAVSKMRDREAARLTRPLVLAASLSGRSSISALEARPSGGDTRLTVADSLFHHAPNLLAWVARANRAKSDDERCELLHLPQAPTYALAETLAPSALVAGALATAIKAFCDLPILNGDGGAGRFSREIDGLANDFALTRAVAGTHFPFENHHDLRVGEALALRQLRSALERANVSVTLCLQDFDGALLVLRSEAGVFGRARVALLRNGETVDWPSETRPPRPKLTAVV